MKKIKVAVLNNIIAPYKIPLFNSLAKNKNIDIDVLFLSRTAHNRRWKTQLYEKDMHFRYRILPCLRIPFFFKEKIEYIINPTFLYHLFRKRYDVIITSGWVDMSCHMTYLLSSLFGYKYIIWSESTVNEPSIQRTLTRPFVQWIVRHASGYIATGSRSKAYLVTLGADVKKIAVAYSTVDVAHFLRKSIMSLDEKNTMKENLHIPSKNSIILFVGQFIKRKGIAILLRAFREIHRSDVSLMLLGYGQEEEHIRTFMKDYPELSISIIPHIEVDEMPKFYGMADIFLLPSAEETWGLVVNEAMASGLPVIVSNKVGCASDLVRNGENGYVFNSGRYIDLRDSIIRLLENKKLRLRMGENSRALVRSVLPSHAARQFITAIHYAYSPT
jgi:glycosyltransferase involved in cell wall biosynthesis